MNRRATDHPRSSPYNAAAHFEGRMASLETQVQNQGRVVEDFIRETRKSTGELFDGLNRLSDAINGQKATNWQQLGVMLSMATAVGGFIYMAFVAPLQEGQRRGQATFEKQNEIDLELLERIHSLELELVKYQGGSK